MLMYSIDLTLDCLHVRQDYMFKIIEDCLRRTGLYFKVIQHGLQRTTLFILKNIFILPVNYNRHTRSYLINLTSIFLFRNDEFRYFFEHMNKSPHIVKLIDHRSRPKSKYIGFSFVTLERDIGAIKSKI